MNSERALERVGELGLLAVVRAGSRADALEVASALIEGGVPGIEVAFTTPEAHRVIQDLSQEYADRILLGAGTVTTHEQVERATAAGATFLVSPGCDPELLPALLGTGLLVLPGTLTPSEVMLARRIGAEALKLFPGSSGGPSHLKALMSPFPGVPFVPTGGVSPENVADWFAAGAFAVGAGGSLAPATLTENGRAKVVDDAGRFAKAVRDAQALVRAG